MIGAASYAQLSSLCADAMLACLSAKPGALICLATGYSPRGAYQEFVRRARETRLDLSQAAFLKLDEWLGLAMDDPATSESFLQREIIQPLDLPAAQYISFHSSPPDPGAECRRVAAEIERRGPIDLMILGVGRNGHIALNEPAEELISEPHVASLAETTHSDARLPAAIRQGLTVGLGGIFSARQVVLLVAGASKAPALRAFRGGQISTRWPVTLLNLHPNLLAISEPDAE